MHNVSPGSISIYSSIFYLFLNLRNKPSDSFEDLCNNGFAAEDTNDNITCIDSHKQLLSQSIYDLWQLDETYMYLCGN